MWWQARPGDRPPDRDEWTLETEDEFGPWGKLYIDDEGRTIGLIQYGPASRFPRAPALPAGPPARDAALVTCAYLVDAHSPWVLQSLFLAAIGECKVRGFPSLEAFAYRYPPRRVVRRPVPRPPDDLPRRLPARLRVPDPAKCWAESSWSASTSGVPCPSRRRH